MGERANDGVDFSAGREGFAPVEGVGESHLCVSPVGECIKREWEAKVRDVRAAG